MQLTLDALIDGPRARDAALVRMAEAGDVPYDDEVEAAMDRLRTPVEPIAQRDYDHERRIELYAERVSMELSPFHPDDGFAVVSEMFQPQAKLERRLPMELVESWLDRGGERGWHDADDEPSLDEEIVIGDGWYNPDASAYVADGKPEKLVCYLGAITVRVSE